MTIIKEHRMENTFLYRIVEKNDEYLLEYYCPTKKVLIRGSLDVVEQMFAEKTGSGTGLTVTLSVTPEVVASVADYTVDCANDPCEHPNCDCKPIAAPTEPQPFGE